METDMTGANSELGGATVAHCATPFLPVNGSWIYNQLTQLQRYRPIVLTQEARNSSEFPVATLYSAETYGPVRKMANRLVRKWTGEYPFYSDILRREGARLIHAHFGYQGCRCLRAKRVAQLPLVTSFYGADASLFPADSTWRRRYERLFAMGELFLVEGSAMAQRLLALGCPESKLVVHHLGVDVEQIHFSERLPSDRVQILICAEFREKKGIAGGIRAIGRALEGLVDVDCRIRIIGEGPERPQIEAAIAASGLGDRVELVGRQPYSVVLEELQSSHFLLQPRLTAADGDSEGGAPVILLDAQASGLPVISTDHGDIPEYVLDGESGYLAKEGDVAGLAELIRRVVLTPETWAQLGHRGRRHVEESYSASTQSARLESIYDRFQ